MNFELKLNNYEDNHLLLRKQNKILIIFLYEIIIFIIIIMFMAFEVNKNVGVVLN